MCCTLCTSSGVVWDIVQFVFWLPSPIFSLIILYSRSLEFFSNVLCFCNHWLHLSSLTQLSRNWVLCENVPGQDMVLPRMSALSWIVYQVVIMDNTLEGNLRLWCRMCRCSLFRVVQHSRDLYSRKQRTLGVRHTGGESQVFRGKWGGINLVTVMSSLDVYVVAALKELRWSKTQCFTVVLTLHIVCSVLRILRCWNRYHQACHFDYATMIQNIIHFTTPYLQKLHQTSLSH